LERRPPVASVVDVLQSVAAFEWAVARPQERPQGWGGEVMDFLRQFVPRLLEDDHSQVRLAAAACGCTCVARVVAPRLAEQAASWPGLAMNRQRREPSDAAAPSDERLLLPRPLLGAVPEEDALAANSSAPAAASAAALRAKAALKAAAASGELFAAAGALLDRVVVVGLY
jgi:hypothetical protein